MNGIGRARFGLFEFDSSTGELRRDGVAVKLQPQPAQVADVRGPAVDVEPAHRAAAEAGGAVTRGKQLPPEQVERRREAARRLGLRPTGRWAGREWTKKQLRLLGALPDAELAERIGRTENAVRVMRTRQGIASARDRRRRPSEGGA